MSFNKVKELRKQGKLNEALELAEQMMKADADDIWNKRAIVWVYYSYLKIAVSNKNVAEFIKQVANIKNLNLDSSEKMAFDSVAWSVGKLLFAIDEMEDATLNNIFTLIKDFDFTKPADSYSFLLKAFKKHAIGWKGFNIFVDWWGLSNFHKNDYENYVSDTGKRFPSLVESIYIAISKNLLTQPVDREDVSTFLPKIKTVCENYPKMQYPPYYYAKLLIAIGDKEHFMVAFLPFARKKQKDFWVWNLMSEVFQANSQEYFSCLCKSIECGAPDKFTINVREKLADVFVNKNMLPQAKFEYLKILEIRKNEGWVLNEKHLDWSKTQWWIVTEAVMSNIDIYKSNATVAMGLLLADTPEEIVCVDYVNTNKKIINFIVSKQKYGFASYSLFNIKPKAGDIFAIRFEEKTDIKSNFYVIVSINNTNLKPSTEIYKNVEGKLQIKSGNSFGFVNNVFISPKLIKQQLLNDGMPIKGKAILSYNKKRKAWGWNVIEIKLK